MSKKMLVSERSPKLGEWVIYYGSTGFSDTLAIVCYNPFHRENENLGFLYRHPEDERRIFWREMWAADIYSLFEQPKKEFRCWKCGEEVPEEEIYGDWYQCYYCDSNFPIKECDHEWREEKKFGLSILVCTKCDKEGPRITSIMENDKT